MHSLTMYYARFLLYTTLIHIAFHLSVVS